MVSAFAKKQLAVFTVLTVATLVILGGHYLRVPSLLGLDQYTLKADLPASGGLYRTANVTYRGATIGKVTAVEPTKTGVQATLSIDDHYRIPVDAIAKVHSVSAVGEQYLDLVSAGNPAGKFLSSGQTITKGTVPEEIGTALDAVDRGLAALPQGKIASLLDETSQAVGGLGPALHRLVDSTQALTVTWPQTPTTSTPSSPTSGPCWTARPPPVPTSGAGCTTSTPWPPRPPKRPAATQRARQRTPDAGCRHRGGWRGPRLVASNVGEP